MLSSFHKPLERLFIIFFYASSHAITDCEKILCIIPSLLCSFCEPKNSLFVVTLNFLCTEIIDMPYYRLSLSIAFYSCHHCPIESFCITTFHPIAVDVFFCKLHLCLHITIFSLLFLVEKGKVLPTVPITPFCKYLYVFDTFLLILLNADTIYVASSQVRYTLRMVLLGSFNKPLHAFGLVFANAFPKEIRLSQFVLRLCIAGIGCGL